MKKFIVLGLIISLSIAGLTTFKIQPAYAAATIVQLTCGDGTKLVSTGDSQGDVAACAKHGGVKGTKTVPAPKAPATPAPGSTCTGDNKIPLSSPLLNGQTYVCKNAPGGVIFAYLRMIIQFLSGAVGLVVVLMIVIGGVQYATSIGDPAQVKAAKGRITNAVTGLVLFLLMFAILNFLIPGGIIGS